MIFREVYGPYGDLVWGYKDMRAQKWPKLLKITDPFKTDRCVGGHLRMLVKGDFDIVIR